MTTLYARREPSRVHARRWDTVLYLDQEATRVHCRFLAGRQVGVGCPTLADSTMHQHGEWFTLQWLPAKERT